MAPPRGYPIVLTADRTLTADYRLLFDGMLAASQTTTVPPALLSPLLMPKAAIGPDGRVSRAPLGLRRIEAALLAGGFGEEEVAVVAEDELAGAIGPATRIVGISSGEPAGLGMNSSTMTAVAGGRIYPEALFRRLLARAQVCIARAGGGAKLVLGGPGAWQLAANSATQKQLGVHHVLAGYAEAEVAQVFRSLLNGEQLPNVIACQGVGADAIPAIRRASTMGVVEISRGCGLGCSFCTIGHSPMRHLPPETILADARTNISAGQSAIAALSEDFFRYGASGMNVDPPALIDLLTRLRTIPGLNLIQIDHANVISIAQYTDEQLATIRKLLVGESGCDYPWVNVGIETACGDLLRANGGLAKIGRRLVDEWGEHSAHQLRRLCRAGFFPMASLMIGLSGETDEHVRRNVEWVRSISDQRISAFPVMHAPIDGRPALRPRDLSRAHWQLIDACYDLNFRWIPRMYWDNQTAAGVGLGRRLLLQAMGRGQVLQWKMLFAWHSRRAKR